MDILSLKVTSAIDRTSVLSRCRVVGRVATLLASGLLVSCGRTKSGAETYTLYRNSPFDHTERVHWATFDVSDALSDINRNQCNMAARLLNANVEASAKAEDKDPYVGVGFWCEPGSYSEEGPVPAVFDAEYPTDVNSGPHF